jgi:L-cystine uptake protein TcyP (sodium:dicarboxylate symporter family)
VYGALCVVAIEILVGAGASGSSGAKKATAGVLGWPAGTWIVGIAGVVFVGLGLYQGYRGASREFLKDSKTEEMSSHMKRWITVVGVFGHLARMVVFGLVGVFLVKAAVDFNPRQAVGLDGVLAKLIHHSYGPSLLGVVAFGLVAFAVYSFSDARYRRI